MDSLLIFPLKARNFINFFYYYFKNIKIGKILNQEQIHEGEINAFSLAKDFSVLLTAAKDGGKLVDPKTLKQIRVFKQEFPMYSSAISPLFVDKNAPKFHGLIGGGIPARMAAKTKVFFLIVTIIFALYSKEVLKFI